MGDTANVGIVVIGRNEGVRLERCLASLAGSGCAAVYVDSDSSDDSAAVAARFGVHVIKLEGRLSAARARNAGFACLAASHPRLRLVQFLDGDCTLEPGWIEAAAQTLASEPRCAAVIGHLRERDAQASPYNRLCALEWRSPAGKLDDYGRFGGIAMIRAAVFGELGGFRADMVAGEDSELAVRLALGGHAVTKIDHVMATHDAAMTRFGQWWRRAVRAGHALGERARLNGSSRVQDCVHERNSTLFWGIALPLAIAFTLAPAPGASLVLALGYPLLGLRVWRGRRRAGDARGEAALYAAFILLGKFANALGLVTFYLRPQARLIEYK
jgi:GT2 family glycosyltransferase